MSVLADVEEPLELIARSSLGPLCADWAERHCVIPDRAVRGNAFVVSDAQLAHLIHQHRIHPDATYDPDKPAAPFVYNGSVLVKPQKWGKGPFSAARICHQAVGPALFVGWAQRGDRYLCSEHGCGCGWRYDYLEGEPMGWPWATPHIQVAAVAEDQTDNIWRALKPMIEEGPLSAVIPDTGLQRINLPGGGLVEPVSSEGKTRLGARLTYCELDEPHLMTSRNGGELLSDTMRRNAAGTGGRWAATGNAYDPSENSVEQYDVEGHVPDIYVDYIVPPAGSWGDKRERRRILRSNYLGSPWVDLDRIESECVRLAAKGKAAEAERFYGNRIVAGASAAFDVLTDWRPLRLSSSRLDELEEAGVLVAGPPDVLGAPARYLVPAPGRVVTLGMDGARTQDTTGVVGVDVELGYQFVIGAWERPRDLKPDELWEVSTAEVDETIRWAFATWDVWRLNADPPYWETPIDTWAGEFGAERVFAWWTNRTRAMALAIKAFRSDWRLDDDRYPTVLTHDGNALLDEHLGNAVRQMTKIRDEPDGEATEEGARGPGEFLWVIRKESPRSTRKIDLAMAAILAWEARGLAIAGGALKRKKYRRAAW